MKKILVINGVNLNLLGIREPELYGDKDYASLKSFIYQEGREKGLQVRCVQSNSEGKIVGYIQKAYKKYDGIVINGGAFTHTSLAILDALKAVDIPTVEVHLTNPKERESYRQFSYISEIAVATYQGEGFLSYSKALCFLSEM